MNKAFLGLALLLMVLVAAACGVASASTPSPTPGTTPTPTIPGGVRRVATGVPFVLRGGESVETAGQYVMLTFVGVVQDSRCPADVVCVRAGDATVAMRLTSQQGPRDFEVLIGEGGTGTHTMDGLTVQLSELLPYPISSAPTPALDDYTVTVVVSLAS